MSGSRALLAVTVLALAACTGGKDTSPATAPPQDAAAAPAAPAATPPPAPAVVPVPPPPPSPLTITKERCTPKPSLEHCLGAAATKKLKGVAARDRDVHPKLEHPRVTVLEASTGTVLYLVASAQRFVEEGGQFDERACETAIEQRDGVEPRVLFHRCGCEYSPDSKAHDVNGDSLPDVRVWFVGNILQDETSLEIYSFNDGRWSRVFKHDRDECESESGAPGGPFSQEYRFHDARIDVRCNPMDDSVAKGHLKTKFIWDGTQFAKRKSR